LSSHGRLVCFNAHDRGICTNRRTIKREELEARVLNGIKNQMFEAAAFAAFCENYEDEVRRLRQEHTGKLAGARREITKLDRRSRTS